MSFLTEATAQDVERLSDIELTDLLNRLIGLECEKHQLVANHHVNLKITIPDGGEDGRVQWTGGPDFTKRLPTRLVLFQVKKSTTPVKLAEEVIDEKTKQIKPRIKEVLSAGGSYLVFCGQSVEKKGIDARIDAIHKSLQKHGMEIDKSRISFVDANQGRDWANQYVAAVTFVIAKAGRHPLAGTDVWEGKAKYSDHSDIYVRGDDRRDASETELRSFLCGKERVARVYGMAGLGKTRMVIESSRPDIAFPHLRGILFADANQSASLPAFMKQCRATGTSGCIVVDNCDPDLHDLLQKEAEHADSKIRLLTIGSEAANVLKKIPQIELLPVQASVIKQQLTNICPSLPANDIDFIVDQLAEGFPQMAVLLANARLNEEPDIRKIVGKTLVTRLLGLDTTSSPQALLILNACAIFAQLGFSDEKSDEYKAIAEFEGIDPELFYATLKPFMVKGVVNQKGRYVEIRPRPLAWRLAADWWASCSPDKAKRLAELELPEAMVNALCERVRMLDGVKECVELTEGLCSHSGPFGQAELLNSEMGSKLFRAFSEVNPSACTTAINFAFRDWSQGDLHDRFGPGRRNIVWALERLCFWETHFSEAGRFLLRLAATENEDWSNNATGVLSGFFAALLSGTQAGPKLRLDLARYALQSPDEKVQLVGVKCLGKALESRHFTRMAGSEQQGSQPPMQDWRPKIWQEIYDYWDAAIDELAIARTFTTTRNAAIREVTNHLRGLFSRGRFATFEKAMTCVADADAELVPEILDALRTIERHDLANVPQSNAQSIKEWQDRLTPSRPEERLVAVVVQAPWDHEECANGDFVDVSAEKAIALGNALALTPHLLAKHISDLLFGEQRQTYAFAEAVGKTTANPCRLASVTLKRYTAKKSELWNASFLAGFVAGVASRDKVDQLPLEEFLTSLVVNKSYLPLAIPALISAGLNSSRLKLLYEPIEAEHLDARQIRGLSSGRATKNIETYSLVHFCLRCSAKGAAFTWAAIDVLFMHCHGDSQKWAMAADGLAQLLFAPHLFDGDFSPTTMDLHHFEKIAENLLESSVPNFSADLARMIANTCSLLDSRFSALESFGRVALKVLKSAPEIHWETLAHPLLSPDWHVRVSMAQTLGNSLGDKSGESAISAVPLDVLLNWCLKNVDSAPQALVENAPLFDATNTCSFSKLIESVLLQFGSNDDVLSALNVNMFSFGWTGSPVPYYERLSASLKSLLELNPSQKIINWAKSQIADLDRLIERQKLEDIERI